MNKLNLLRATNKIYDAFQKDSNTLILLNFNKTTFTPNSWFYDECGVAIRNIIVGSPTMSFGDQGLTFVSSVKTDRNRLVPVTALSSETKRTLRSFTTTSQFTLECFCKQLPFDEYPSNLPKGGNIIFALTDNNAAFDKYVDSNNQLINYGSTTLQWQKLGGTNLVDYPLAQSNAWLHLAVCINKVSGTSNTVTYFINGVKQSTLGTYSGPSGSSLNPSLYFLGTPAATQYWDVSPCFKGTIKGLRMSEGIRYTENFSNKVDLINLRIRD